jgi:competence protein ComEC
VPIRAAAILIPLTPRPDVLIAENGRIFAVRGADETLLLSPGRANNFTRQSWIEREGQSGSDTWPEDGEEKNMPVRCDGDACLYQSKGHLVSFVKDYIALQKDCTEADIVISPLGIPPEICAAPHLLLDKGMFRYNGAYALYFNSDGGVTVKTVRAGRGDRPWTGAQAYETDKPAYPKTGKADGGL